MTEEIYTIDEKAKDPSIQIKNSIKEFNSEIETLESRKKLPFIIMQDGKSKAYYVECHIDAKTANPLVDINAALDPEEQEEFRLQRELRPKHSAFIKMCSDALDKRHFSDIIAEYDKSYRSDKPLKILVGQHRFVAMERAYDQKRVSRSHGFKIYFNLKTEQRYEIAQIANTNISISSDLWDRMQETSFIGPFLRKFCQSNGILKKKEDFADRKNPEGRITVRLARTLLVNFYDGIRYKGDIDEDVFNPYVSKSGEIDKEYFSLAQKKETWKDMKLNEAAYNFSILHKRQMEAISRNPTLRKYQEFKNKALTPAIISSWTLTAGLLQRNKNRLAKLYLIPNYWKNQDPLLAKEMSESKHINDPETYRGLGTRTDKKDKGRLVELFLQYSTLNLKKGISKNLIDSARALCLACYGLIIRIIVILRPAFIGTCLTRTVAYFLIFQKTS